ncbi:MAG: hypothetical protein IPK04_15640 [Bdellovibrionales bacterium]|nr:hypothetical protein [Bdellovibrionales bacterium]
MKWIEEAVTGTIRHRLFSLEAEGGMSLDYFMERIASSICIRVNTSLVDFRFLVRLRFATGDFARAKAKFFNRFRFDLGLFGKTWDCI